jgi:hypothetical protein
MATLTGKQIAGEGLHGWSFLLGGLQTRAITSTATGLRLDAAGLSRLEPALDTPAHESVLPFWAAVLAVRADPDGNRVCLCTWQERG